ncbi:MAG: hypothetical protein QOD26_3344 [Betaproteobacteria bacterium]|jgi:hypothetical protein|nr:hypothetical protein [Betaproteobacteria bacterium]
MLGAVAHADLYRWVDPETGSAKFSNAPPPWYETGSGPQVERIPYAPPGARAPAPDPLAPTPVAALQARWQEMLLTVSSQPTRESMQALVALTAELDRADPAGARRRQQEVTNVMRSLQK